MGITNLAGTIWKFNNTVNAPTSSCTVGATEYSNTKALVKLIYTTNNQTFEVDCYPIQAYGGGGGYYSLHFATNMWIAYSETTRSGFYDALKNGVLEFYSGFKVTGEFVSWLEANATLVVSTTVITYGGETTEMENGQTATFKCAGKKMTTDIVITPEFPVEIAYGDIINEAHKGQTATLKCAGKKMKHDVVVSTKVEEDDSIVGTWVLNDTFSAPDTNNRLFISYANTSEAESIGTLALKDGTVINLANAYFSSSTGRYFGVQIFDGGTNVPVVMVGTINQEIIEYRGNSSCEGAVLTINRPVLYDEGGLEWLKANATKQ